MEAAIKRFRRVYEMLEDEESRDIYLTRLNWLISDDKRYIDQIVDRYLNGIPSQTALQQEILARMRGAMPAGRKIVLYGAGKTGRDLIDLWKEDERFFGFCSQSKKQQECGYLGYPTISPEELLLGKEFSVVINVENERYYQEIKEVLREGNYPEGQIYEYVSDEGIRGFRIDDEKQYFDPDIMKLEDEEVFVDAGCFDLATSLALRRRCKHVKKVYAFEPDPQNYQVCLRQIEKEAFWEVELLPYGIWSKRCRLHFNATSGVDSAVSENGEFAITATTIDETIAPEDRVTTIKMDLEGSEQEALRGARETILRDRPKLAVCIYHGLEDMTEIPLYIKELVPEYKIYIRHYSNCDSETVLYAVMS